MAIRNIIASGIGFGVGGPWWIVTRGFGDVGGSGPNPPVPIVTFTGILSMTAVAYDALIGAIGLLYADDFWADATVHLFQNDIIPTPTSLISEFTEADYDGYAAKDLVVTSPPSAFVSEFGDVIAQFPHVVFQPTGTTTPNTIYGWWLQGPGGLGGADILLYARRFDEQVNLLGPLQALVVEARFPIGQPAGF